MANLATISNNILADSGIDPITLIVGSGTVNYIPKFTASGTIGNSAITDNGTTVTLVSRALAGTSAAFTGAVSANNPSEGATGEGLIAGRSFKIDATGAGQRAVMYVVSNVLSDTYGSGLQIQGANFAGDKAFGFNLNTSGGFELYTKSTAPAFVKALTAKANQQIQFNQYGSGTFTGTRAYDLAIDSSGNIIEVAVGAGTVTGSGTANEITYWTGSSSIGSLTTATYPSLTELSYVKGVTSAIQTQLNGKLSLSGGTMTGAITLVNGAIGIYVGDDASISDGNVANNMFVAGVQNNDRGYINFSSSSGNALGAINGGALTWRGVNVMTASNISGTVNYIPKFTAANTLENSVMSTDSSGNFYVNVAYATNASPTIQINSTDAGSGQGNPRLILSRNGEETLRVEGVANVEGRIKAVAANVGVLTFYTGTNTEKMRLNASGQLGIGVDPTQSLDIIGNIKVRGNNQYFGSSGAGDNVITIYSQNGSYSEIRSNAGASGSYNGIMIASNYNAANSLPSWSIDLGGALNSTANVNAYTLAYRSYGGSWSSLMVVDAAGRTAIKGTPGTAPFEVFTDSFAGAGSIIVNSVGANANQAGLVLKAGYAATSTSRATRIDFLNIPASTTVPRWTLINDYSQNGTNDFRFVLSDQTTSALTLLQSGNVGINYTNPTTKLYVAGTSTFTDESYFLDKLGVGTVSLTYKAEVSGAIGNYWNGTAFTGTPLALAISNTQPGGYDPVLLYRQTDSGGTVKISGGIGTVGTGPWTAGNNATQTSDMYFLVRNNSGGITERLRISSTGYATFSSNIQALSAIYVRASGNSDLPFINFSNADGAYNWGRVGGLLQGDGDGSLYFQTKQGGSLGTRLTINSLGNSTFTGSVAAGTTMSWNSGTGALSYSSGVVTMETNSATRIELKTNGTTALTLNTNQTAKFANNTGFAMDPTYRVDVSGSIRGSDRLLWNGQNQPIYILNYNNLSLPGCTIETDATASQGSAAKRASSSASGTMFYGNYTSFPPGNYVAYFRLKVTSNSSTSYMGWIDVSGSGLLGGKIVINPSLFAASNTYQYFRIPFTITSASSIIEWRYIDFQSGITDMWLDHVMVYQEGGYADLVSSGNMGFWVNSSSSASKAMTLSSVGELWLGYTSDQGAYLLQVNGTIYASGDVIAYSDISVKNNIRPIDNVLSRISNSRGVLYDRTDKDEKNNIGFIAQELEQQFPELVSTNSDGTKGVKYQNAVAVLFEAIKEQQKQIDELKNRN